MEGTDPQNGLRTKAEGDVLGKKDKEERTDPLSDTRSGDEEAARTESPSVTAPQGRVRESTDTKGHTQQPISQRRN